MEDQRAHKHHHAILHPVELRIFRHRAGMGWVGKANDWMATHLAILFGVAWTIWVFFIVPLVAYFLPAKIQAHIFFFSSGWIQLFALPLMIYVGNKLQRSSDAQSQVMYQGMTHIASVSDESADRLDLSTSGGLADVHDEVRKLREDVSGLAETVRAVLIAQRAPAERPRQPRAAKPKEKP
jgi:hypothetical protein